MNNIRISYHDIISNDIMSDFKLLYYSKYNIISNSSFSWWTTWLSDNKIVVIGPDRWFNYKNKELGFEPDVYTKKIKYI